MSSRFIGIGAQKCASSWLYDILADHPEIGVSDAKELDFFSYRYEYGYRWYESHFPVRDGARVKGEISPSYFNEASVPERAKLFDPSMKIILSLRDPVERAFSQHRHLLRIGLVNESCPEFEDALKNNPSYVEQGMYAHHLERWLRYFPREQIKVVLMEEIQQNPTQVAEDVYEFLGVDTRYRSASLYEKSNPSYALRSRGLDRVVCTLRGVADRTRLGFLWRGLGHFGLQRLYRDLNRKPSQMVIPRALPETVQSLKETFREDTIRLQSMLGVDLGAWL